LQLATYTILIAFLTERSQIHQWNQYGGYAKKLRSVVKAELEPRIIRVCISLENTFRTVSSVREQPPPQLAGDVQR
jgi:hypothetical protein